MNNFSWKPVVSGFFVGCVLLVASFQVFADEQPAIVQWPNRVELSTPVSGIVVEVLVQPGDRVTKDQTLLRLDTRVREAMVEQAKANVARDERLKAEAQRELDRAQELFDRTVLSEHELELARIGFAKGNAEFETAKAALVQAEVDLDYSIVRAPFNGIVVSSFAQIGQTVLSKLEPDILFVFAAAEHMIARARISPNQLAGLKVGQDVTVEFTGKQYRGKIQQFGLEPASGAGKDARYTLDVSFHPGTTLLRSGLQATIILP
jgi:RND family efflux transporter MFP subunit